MPWQIDELRRLARHAETDTLFELRAPAPGPLDGPDGFELVPPSGSGSWPAARLAAMKREILAALPAAREHRDRQRQLEYLIRAKAAGSNVAAAAILSRLTGRSVTARAVQAWLIAPTARSSRSCPAWAIEALDRYVAPAEGGEMTVPETATAMALERTGVEWAENAIDADRRLRRKWTSLMAPAAAEEMIRMERRLDDYVQAHNRQLLAIITAFEKSTSFEDCRNRALQKLNDLSTSDFLVRNTRRAIEEKDEEFRDDDGES